MKVTRDKTQSVDLGNLVKIACRRNGGAWYYSLEE